MVRRTARKTVFIAKPSSPNLLRIQQDCSTIKSMIRIDLRYGAFSAIFRWNGRRSQSVCGDCSPAGNPPRRCRIIHNDQRGKTCVEQLSLTRLGSHDEAVAMSLLAKHFLLDVALKTSTLKESVVHEGSLSLGYVRFSLRCSIQRSF